jgi:hypothetical protein
MGSRADAGEECVVQAALANQTDRYSDQYANEMSRLRLPPSIQQPVSVSCYAIWFARQLYDIVR